MKSCLDSQDSNTYNQNENEADDQDQEVKENLIKAHAKINIYLNNNVKFTAFSLRISTVAKGAQFFKQLFCSYEIEKATLDVENCGEWSEISYFMDILQNKQWEINSSSGNISYLSNKNQFSFIGCQGPPLISILTAINSKKYYDNLTLSLKLQKCFNVAKDKAVMSCLFSQNQLSIQETEVITYNRAPSQLSLIMVCFNLESVIDILHMIKEATGTQFQMLEAQFQILIKSENNNLLHEIIAIQAQKIHLFDYFITKSSSSNFNSLEILQPIQLESALNLIEMRGRNLHSLFIHNVLNANEITLKKIIEKVPSLRQLRIEKNIKSCIETVVCLDPLRIFWTYDLDFLKKLNIHINIFQEQSLRSVHLVVNCQQLGEDLFFQSILNQISLQRFLKDFNLQIIHKCGHLSEENFDCILNEYEPKYLRGEKCQLHLHDIKGLEMFEFIKSVEERGSITMKNDLQKSYLIKIKWIRQKKMKIFRKSNLHKEEKYQDLEEQLLLQAFAENLLLLPFEKVKLIGEFPMSDTYLDNLKQKKTTPFQYFKYVIEDYESSIALINSLLSLVISKQILNLEVNQLIINNNFKEVEKLLLKNESKSKLLLSPPEKFSENLYLLTQLANFETIKFTSVTQLCVSSLLLKIFAQNCIPQQNKEVNFYCKMGPKRTRRLLEICKKIKLSVNLSCDFYDMNNASTFRQFTKLYSKPSQMIHEYRNTKILSSAHFVLFKSFEIDFYKNNLWLAFNSDVGLSFQKIILLISQVLDVFPSIEILAISLTEQKQLTRNEASSIFKLVSKRKSLCHLGLLYYEIPVTHLESNFMRVLLQYFYQKRTLIRMIPSLKLVGMNRTEKIMDLLSFFDSPAKSIFLSCVQFLPKND